MGSQRLRLILLIVIFGCSFAGVRAATRYRLGQTRQPNWNAVPYQFAGWTGQDGRFDPVYGTDPADTSLLRVYRRGSNPPVIAYVGFYSSLATIMEVHTPEICYPAQGWAILSGGRSNAGMYRGEPIPAREIVVDKTGDRRLVMWWYNAGARPFESRLRYIYSMLALSTVTGRTDGSMVRLETLVPD